MTQIKIDKHVPIPPSKAGVGAQTKYPFADLEIGDSFHHDNTQRRLACAAAAHAKKFGKKFTTRSENGGTRVWRIA